MIMQTFGILSKINIVLVLFYGMALTMRTKARTIQQNNNVIDGVNLGTDAKRITHGQCKVLTLCQLLDRQCKKWHYVKNSDVNSAIYTDLQNFPGNSKN